MPSWFSSLTDQDFAASVQSLMPRGRAWSRRPESVTMAFMAAIADCLFATHQVAVRLLEVESDPAQAVELLPDWEMDYGLPDAYSAPDPTIQQRHNTLLAKIASSPGGQSAVYYTAFAAALGYTITITTWTPWTAWDSPWLPITGPAWRFAWQVTAPELTATYSDCWSSPWDPPWAISDTELQGRLQEIAPAYGILLVNYG